MPRQPQILPVIELISREAAQAGGLKLYFTGEPCRKGHLVPRYTYSGHCMECRRAWGRIQRRQRYAQDPTYFMLQGRQRRVRDPLGELFRGARARAKWKGTEFSITKADLDMNGGICPCCGREMAVASNLERQQAESPSIDRLNPKLGYVPGNVTIICWRCNDIKRNSTIEELRTVLSWMERSQYPQLVVHSLEKSYAR